MKSKAPSLLFLLLSLCVALASAQITALRGSRFLQDEQEPPTTDDIQDTASQGLATVGVIIVIIVVVVVACACALIGWFCCCGDGFCGGLFSEMEVD
mmetsp:Transcript_16849/g.32016  ORF Transcript_16849/g.32016 Transcript_16849/m.32016 type:complete len:97 (-) Transcript_16849:48-338(-)